MYDKIVERMDYCKNYFEERKFQGFKDFQAYATCIYFTNRKYMIRNFMEASEKRRKKDTCVLI